MKTELLQALRETDPEQAAAFFEALDAICDYAQRYDDADVLELAYDIVCGVLTVENE